MRTAHERATEVVNKWVQETGGMPFTIYLNRLGLAIAEAIAAAEDAAFERGRADAILNCSETCINVTLNPDADVTDGS